MNMRDYPGYGYQWMWETIQVMDKVMGV
jgi:hypothetical protein